MLKLHLSVLSGVGQAKVSLQVQSGNLAGDGFNLYEKKSSIEQNMLNKLKNIVFTDSLPLDQ